MKEKGEETAKNFKGTQRTLLQGLSPLEINLKLLKEKAYELADWENLLKEIENTARSDLKEGRHKAIS